MKKLVQLMIATCVLLTAGCNTLPKVVVTIVDAEDAAMREWADAHNRGFTSKELDAKVDKAHQNFVQVCHIAKSALEAYKATGNEAQYVQAIATVRAAANGVLDLVVNIVSSQRKAELQKMLDSANTIGGQ